jgi:hypothetical protein
MSKETREFFERLKNVKNDDTPAIGTGKAIGEGLKEGIMAFRDGLGQVWDAATPMFDHGRTELAAALFSGHAHVMYMHNENAVEEPQRELTSEPLQKKQEGRGLEI